jgi:hypothetical protein
MPTSPVAGGIEYDPLTWGGDVGNRPPVVVSSGAHTLRSHGRRVSVRAGNSSRATRSVGSGLPRTLPTRRCFFAPTRAPSFLARISPSMVATAESEICFGLEGMNWSERPRLRERAYSADDEVLLTRTTQRGQRGQSFRSPGREKRSAQHRSAADIPQFVPSC